MKTRSDVYQYFPHCWQRNWRQNEDDRLTRDILGQWAMTAQTFWKHAFLTRLLKRHISSDLPFRSCPTSSVKTHTLFSWFFCLKSISFLFKNYFFSVQNLFLFRNFLFIVSAIERLTSQLPKRFISGYFELLQLKFMIRHLH